MKISKSVLNVVFALFGLALAAMAFYYSRDFPRPHDAQLGAAVFPRITGLLLAVSAAVIIVSTLVERTGEQAVFLNKAKVAGGFAATLVFSLLLPTIGFLLLSPVYLAVLLRLAGARRPVVLIAVSIGVTVLIYLMFKVLLESPLPAGLLEVQD